MADHFKIILIAISVSNKFPIHVPTAQAQYQAHHPTNYQPGKPDHGPGSLHGPVAMRGPVPQHSPKPHEQGGYNSRPPPQRDAPSRRYSSRPPPPEYNSRQPPQYRDGPPPEEYHSGPPPQSHRPHYRTELIGYVEEPEEGDLIPNTNARQLVVPRPRPNVNQYNGYISNNYQRQVPLTYRPGTNMGYQNRRVIAYPGLSSFGGNQVYPARRPDYQQQQRYPYNRGYYSAVGQGYPVSRRPVGYYPRSVPQSPFRPTPVVLRALEESTEADDEVPVVVPHSPLARFYNPSWGSAYNPEYVVNPTLMRSRRRFR